MDEQNENTNKKKVIERSQPEFWSEKYLNWNEKKPLEGFNSRSEVKGKVSTLEDKSFQITQSEEQKEN